MRNLKLLTLSAFLFIGSLSLSAQEMGVVDLESVYNSLAEKQDADNQMNALYERHKTEIEKRQNALEAIENEIKTKVEGKSQAEIQAMMPELEARQKDYMTKQQELVTYQQAATKEVTDKEKALYTPIDTKVKNAIDQVAASKGVKFVMEKSTLLYASGLDLTQDVKTNLGAK
ncbi:MAG: OmpH family outer membrane protein [Weeksellaceae bacterium]